MSSLKQTQRDTIKSDLIGLRTVSLNTRHLIPKNIYVNVFRNPTLTGKSFTPYVPVQHPIYPWARKRHIFFTFNFLEKLVFQNLDLD